MVNRFLNDLTLGTDVKCQTVTTSSTALANTSGATRTITDAIKASFLAGNNALDNQTFNTQLSSNNSTRIATTEDTYSQSLYLQWYSFQHK